MNLFIKIYMIKLVIFIVFCFFVGKVILFFLRNDREMGEGVGVGSYYFIIVRILILSRS